MLASVESPSQEDNLAIVKRFDFESKLQRMSVVVKSIKDQQYYSYVKGSPEMIKQLSLEGSLPLDYDKVLNEYTMQGFRMIAFAYKKMPSLNYLKVQKMERPTAESDLTFLGFLITENKLKAATNPTITILNQANVRTIMATGDNILTAISVARHCNILKEEQTVFYGDIENGKLVWKRAETLEDDFGKISS